MESQGRAVRLRVRYCTQKRDLKSFGDKPELVSRPIGAHGAGGRAAVDRLNRREPSLTDGMSNAAVARVVDLVENVAPTEVVPRI